MAHKVGTITIENKTFTTNDIMQSVGCCRATAIGRMKSAISINDLLRAINVKNRRIFVIEGVEVTAHDVMIKVPCSKNTAYGRLNKCDTLDMLYRPLGTMSTCTESKNPHNKKMTDMENPINKLLYGK